MNNWFDFSELPRILLEAVIILCFGLLVGLSLHSTLVRDVLTGQLNSSPATSQTREGDLGANFPEPIDLATVQRQIAAGALVVDARIEELYRQGHLPGSVLLPREELDARFADFSRRYPAATPIIVYCSGYGCPDSFELAVALLDKGYHRVMIFEGGFPEWQSAGLPIETGP